MLVSSPPYSPLTGFFDEYVKSSENAQNQTRWWASIRYVTSPPNQPLTGMYQFTLAEEEKTFDMVDEQPRRWAERHRCVGIGDRAHLVFLAGHQFQWMTRSQAGPTCPPKSRPFRPKTVLPG